MNSINASLRDALLSLQRRDLELRAALEAEGTLFDGYHPRMEAVHLDNARQLRELIATHGWPTESTVGKDGAEAAWLVVQHAISDPPFMRHCRDLIERAVAEGRAPAWQFAYLDDRIRVSEGKPQRFGTQYDVTPEGPALYPVDAPKHLDQRRQQFGLRPIAEQLKTMQGVPRLSPEVFEAKQRAERAWRQKVGWIAPDAE